MLEAMCKILAKDDDGLGWVLPLVIFAVYTISNVVKAISKKKLAERESAKKRTEEKSPKPAKTSQQKLRYKPLDYDSGQQSPDVSQPQKKERLPSPTYETKLQGQIQRRAIEKRAPRKTTRQGTGSLRRQISEAISTEVEKRVQQAI